MSTPQDDNQPVVWAVLVAVIVLAVGLAIGFGLAKSKKAALCKQRGFFTLAASFTSAPGST